MKATLFAVLLVFCASTAIAKDRALTAEWSGIWAESTGQHRCGVYVSPAPLRARITLLCQLGPDGVFAQGPVPAFGEPIALIATRSDFGMPPDGNYAWGTARIYAVCSEGLPEIIGTAYASSGAVSDVRLHPVTLALPESLCGGGR